MVYKVPVEVKDGKQRYCYTINCRIHSAAWSQADIAPQGSKEFYQNLFDSTAEAGDRFIHEPNESAAAVIKAIPKKERVRITPGELDAVFHVMRRFGTREDDSWGFRRHIATRKSFYEWSERGAGSRYSQDVSSAGDIYDVHLTSIGNYEENKATYFKGQAEIRQALKLDTYNVSEKAYIAEQYWNANILPTLGDIPQQGGEFLRRQYVADIVKSPTIINEVVDEWEKNPHHRIPQTTGSARVYIEMIVPESDRGYGESTRAQLLRGLEAGSKRIFRKALRDNQDGTISSEASRALWSWQKKGFEQTATTA